MGVISVHFCGSEAQSLKQRSNKKEKNRLYFGCYVLLCQLDTLQGGWPDQADDIAHLSSQLKIELKLGLIFIKAQSIGKKNFAENANLDYN